MTAGIAILLAIVVCTVLWLYPAFRFLRKYEQRLTSQGDHKGRPYREELQLAQVLLHIYKPSRQNGSTLIMVPGLHPEGIRNSRFTAFAETCAEAGFYVVAPDLVEFRNFQITNSGIDTLRSVMDALPQHVPAENRKKIGMLGISYGAGPAFFVATTRKLDFLVSIGGYCNLLHALEFSFSGIHPGGTKRTAHEWGRLIFTMNHIHELAAPEDQEILKKCLSLRLELKVKEAELLEKDLSPAGKDLLQGVLKGLSEDQKNSFLKILLKRKEEALAVSPERILSKLDPATRIYLLHGISDDAVPYEETLELKNGLEEAGFEPRTLVTAGLTHVDLTKVSGIWDLLKMLQWERLLLRER